MVDAPLALDLGERPARQGPARILTVCTGNICRSPYAERVLAGALPPDQVQVSSAGTGALAGYGIDPDAVTVLQRRGVQHDGHRARHLDRAMVQDADLVLAMTREHRSLVARVLPRAVRWTFTALEVARLLAVVDPGEVQRAAPSGTVADRVRALPPLLVAVRGHQPVEPGADDVQDPYRLGPAAFDRMAEQLDPALEALVRVLTAPPA